ncbi:MAG TPA: hypothetical protein VMB84_05685 [Stellaceae bacterium]|nr:hypothetical protein [Stellaceae bacterium]
MNRARRTLRRTDAALAAALSLGAVGCVAGALGDPAGFCGAWLCAFLVWLGVPLAAVTLVLVHDLTGGRWMATARPALAAASATMPLATLAGIPAFIGLAGLYRWAHPDAAPGNGFYLNATGFLLRYAADVVVWNAVAAFALLAPRDFAAPIAPGLSWLSGVGLVLLALSTGFAALDWMMSLLPSFWSSIFPMIAGVGWFNTGLALVLVAVAGGLPRAAGDRSDHLADLAAILLATTILWAYVAFCQFLIVWEENLKSEIPWYLDRLSGGWPVLLWIAVALGFVVPFFVLLSRAAKRSRGVVAAMAGLILASRVADIWWLVLPELPHPAPLWLAGAAFVALGALMLLWFRAALRHGPLRRGARTAWEAGNG